jgi:hypothetical protein
MADIQANAAIPSQDTAIMCPMAESDAATLKDRLSSLKDNGDSARGPIKLAANLGFDGPGSGNDSGYGSAVSTPDSNRHIFINKSKASGPVFYDRSIPDELKDRFFDLKVQYTRSLWEAVSKGKKGANPGDIALKLKYMGDSEDTARLYIVVQCERRIARRVKTFFAQEHIVKDLRPDFEVHVVDKGLIRLSDCEAIDVLAETGDRSTLCGMQIRFDMDGVFSLATFGGLVVATSAREKSLYGLTAGHPLSTVLAGALEHWPSSESDSDEEYMVDTDPDRGPEQIDQVPSLTHLTGRCALTPVGTIAYSSLDASSTSGNHDWALINLTSETRLPNMLDFEVDTPGLGTAGDLFCAPIPPRLTQKQEVAVLTSHGIQRGLLASNDSSIMVSPGRTFVRTFDLLPCSDSGMDEARRCWWLSQRRPY